MFMSRIEVQRQALRLYRAKRQAAEAAEQRERDSHRAQRPPSSGSGIAGDGRGAPPSGIDGMTLDHRSYEARLASLGLSLPPGYLVLERPRTPPIAGEVQVACAEAQEAAERARAETAALLEEGRVDGASASPEAAMTRLRDIGLDPGQFPADLFRSKGAPLAAPPNPEKALRMAEEAALRSVNLRIARGERIDVLTLSPEEARAYAKSRGVSAASWDARPGHRVHG
jgi:hypothetical protein